MINTFNILYGAKYFSLGIFENYLVYIPAKKYIKYFSGTTRIDAWKSNEMSVKNIENITKLDNDFAPTFINHHVLPDINFNGHRFINMICLFLKCNEYIYIYIYIYFLHAKSKIKKIQTQILH